MKTHKEILIQAKEYAESIGNEDGTSAYDYVMGYKKCQQDMVEKYTEQDMIKFAFDTYYQEDMANKDKWSFEEILDACYPTLGRGSDWADIVKRLREQKLNKQDNE